MATFTPYLAKRLAVAAPKPEAPPVTTAEMSEFSSMITSSFGNKYALLASELGSALAQK